MIVSFPLLFFSNSAHTSTTFSFAGENAKFAGETSSDDPDGEDSCEDEDSFHEQASMAEHAEAYAVSVEHAEAYAVPVDHAEVVTHAEAYAAPLLLHAATGTAPPPLARSIMYIYLQSERERERERERESIEYMYCI